MARQPSTGWRLYAGVVAIALLLSVVFCGSLVAYWTHYRLGTAGGNGMALVLIALPGSFVLGSMVGTIVARRAVRRGASPRLAFARALFAVALLLIVFIVAEIWRTHAVDGSQDEFGSIPISFVAPAV